MEYTFSNPTVNPAWNTTMGLGGAWLFGRAPFGNYNDGVFNDGSGTYWPENRVMQNDDLWIRRSVDFTGYDLASARWFLGVDNGYKLYVNGVLISQDWSHGYSSRWEYSGAFGAALVQGVNIIALALDDEGSLNAFDMEITADRPTGTPPAFTSTNSFSGTVGVVFSNTVTASGTAPIIFGGSNLPAGLNIITNGLISGVPTTAGLNLATLTASNGFGLTNQSVNFTIAKGTPLIGNWPTASPITVGQAVSDSVLSAGSANVAGKFDWNTPTNRPNLGANLQGVTFTPTDTSNYNTVSTNVSLTVLPPTLLTISGASVSNKVYDGSRTASVSWSQQPLVGVASNHVVSLVTSGADATYDSANTGTGKSVSVTGLSLSGADAGRYEIGPALLLTGTIEPKGLGVSGLVVNKRGYEGSGEVRAPLDWSGHVLSGKVGGDEVYVQTPYGEGKYEDGLVGVNKAVTWWNRDPVLGGGAASNYYVEFPEGELFGEVEKGEVVPIVSGTQRVYNGQRQGVSAVAMVGSNNLAVVTKYWGLSNTVYPTNELGPTNAGVYGVEVKVAESEQNYGGATNVVLTIGKRSAVIAAGSDTIRAGTVFSGTRYTGSGFLDGDTIEGTLVTHLRGVTNTNPLVSYDLTRNESGVYRILRGDVGENVSHNYQIEYREGTLTVLKQSVLTEGTVVPLGMGQGFTAVVMSNGAVTNWGTNTLTIPTVINPSSVGTTNFVGARGLGTGGGASFALAWLADGSGTFWGSTTNSVSNEPFRVAMMVGLSQASETWVGVVRDNGAQEVIPSTIPGGQVTGRVVGLAAGSEHGLSLLGDGTVKAWGSDPNNDRKRVVPSWLSNAVGVAAGQVHSVAVRADGTVVAWGRNDNNATAVPDELTRTNAPNFVRVVAVTAAGLHNVALRADGSLRWWDPPAISSILGTAATWGFSWRIRTIRWWRWVYRARHTRRRCGAMGRWWCGARPTHRLRQ